MFTKCAFVIDYNERFSDSTGVGEFGLILRQKADKTPDVTAEVGLEIRSIAYSEFLQTTIKGTVSNSQGLIA
jgi:hypothetical protein